MIVERKVEGGGVERREWSYPEAAVEAEWEVGQSLERTSAEAAEGRAWGERPVGQNRVRGAPEAPGSGSVGIRYHRR